MRRLARQVCSIQRPPALLLEKAGLGLVAFGLNQVYVPASLIFAGAALVFIAKGMERHE